jgi:peptide/nickel transport system substrate-binding protein
LLHFDPLEQTIYLFLNTRVRPFDDVRVRRAINYALDRAVFARLIGGQLVQPTCQILPPNFAGYVRYCPYTSRPSPRGRWSGTDLGKARRLIAASGTKGERIVVWIQPGMRKPGARYLAALLRRLGYRASLKFVSSRTYYDTVRTANTKVQMGGLDGWYADIPVASNFIEPIFRCALSRSKSTLTPNLAEFCDPAIDAEMNKAREVEATNPLVGDRLWTQIEHELVDRAPWAPVGTSREPNLVSKRVGNYEYNPEWRVLVDQLWLQ